ncbi:hypothetical protein M0638_16910 [Roseomonas sp. NAR14]|uniref:Uncharacterized protein n=1 Tax=Roseomonas acroporae TaxID=2937791 RepID=A0A9X2BXK6_9PROT|nr:hypothetical protein [Roseomonas acroporae]MCK8786059.1 hypothetical protein [Roseomonas acroporae]
MKIKPVLVPEEGHGRFAADAPMAVAPDTEVSDRASPGTGPGQALALTTSPA